jgi:uncharacterized protein (DUF2237 family)
MAPLRLAAAIIVTALADKESKEFFSSFLHGTDELTTQAFESVIGEKKKSVLGGDLQSCSKNGMAMTGFTRSGSCVDQGNDDAGSHHICIKMKSDFCTVTGQSNWCEGQMACQEAGHLDKSKQCDIKNWCVCQWAFASYVNQKLETGSCNDVLELDCGATNMAALKAYEDSSDDSIKKALACLKEKCNL